MFARGKSFWLWPGSWAALLALCLFPGPAAGAILPADELPKLRPVPISPALAAAARTNHIALGVFDRLTDTNVLRSGDTVTFLGNFVHKRSRSQWLIDVQVAAPPTNAKAAKQPPPMKVSLFGKEMEFASKPVPARLRMLGPFAATETAPAPKSRERTADFNLNESFLGLGLESAAEVMTRWDFTATNATPVSATNIAGGAKPRLSAADQRAVAGSIPAVTSYLEIVEHVDGLEELLWKLVRWPSVWSMVKGAGIDAGIEFGDAGTRPQPARITDWNLPPGMSLYYFPCLLTLNNEPSIKITLVVTKPEPPYLTCGGVIGVLAEKVGDNETYMTLRITGATHAKE